MLARVTTHAGATVGSGDPRNIASVISGVFADSVQRLAADRQFRALVTEPGMQAAPPPPSLVFALPAQRVTVEDATKEVVVIFAGNAMGSGILISPDGYILTNHHVTGDSDRVRIRWADGAEAVGQVVRSDVRRDVALIHAPGQPNALSIRDGSAKIGETVFAIGTPLDKDFQNTLTRGIVSANRTYEGLTFIQSDVAVDHGNSGGPLLDEQGRVLGIAQWVYAPDGVSHNLNFFIPIDDALRALSLTAAPAPAPLHAAAAPPGRAAKKR